MTRQKSVRKVSANPGAEREVITLRLDPDLKKKLYGYCLKRSSKEGKNVSFNQAILHFIERGLTAA